MRKCGFHVQQTSSELRQAIEVVQPTLCVSLAHDGDFWRGVKRDFPEMLLIGRLFELTPGFSGDWRQVEPEIWAEACAWLAMPYDAFITRNEPDGINNEVTADDAKRYDEWCVRFRERGLELGFEAVGPNVPAGNWHHQDVVNYMPLLCQSFRYISLHEYSARAMWDQAPALERAPSDVPQDDGAQRGWWYTLRYRGWKRAICERWPGREGQFEVVISEGGVAYGVIPDAEGRPKYGDVGWRTDMSEADYLASLDWYTRALNEDDYCRGWAIFMVGAADPKWNSFETLPQAGRLVAIPEIPAQPGPEPNGGSGMEIYNRDGQRLSEADGQALLARYGLAIVPPPGLKRGDRYFAVTKAWEKVSTVAAFVYSVRDIDGQPVHNPDAVLDLAQPHRAFWWQNMGDANDIAAGKEYATDREEQGDLGGLDQGHGGSGMGRGAYTGYDQDPWKGPHRAWIRHPRIASDLAVGVRMIGGTEHDHLDLEWQEVIYEGEELPPPGPPGDPVGRLLEIGDEIKVIAHQLGAGAPVGLTLTFSDGSEVQYGVVSTAASKLGRLWASLLGR